MNFSDKKKSTVASAVVAGIEVELIDEMRPKNSSPRKLSQREQRELFFSLFFFLGFEKFSPVETKREREREVERNLYN